MAFLFFAFFIFIPLFVFFGFIRESNQKREKEALELKIRLHQANVHAVAADTIRVKSGLPGLPGVMEAYAEVNRQLHFSALTAVTPPLAAPAIESSKSSKTLFDLAGVVDAPVVSSPSPVFDAEEIPHADVSEVVSDETIQIRFDKNAKVVIGHFSDFDIYHAVLVVNGSEEHLRTFKPEDGMTEEQIVEEAISSARIRYASHKRSHATADVVTPKVASV